MARLPVSCRSSTSSNTTNSTTAADSAARTATVQVDLGYAAEQVTCKLTQPNSRLAEATMQFPLGLVLESECLAVFHPLAHVQLDNRLCV